ncbi:cystathionine gamma-synthase [Pseudoclavibacter caeni]|jgi:cystathionine gamma-synthase|uniref:Cystathionine gamma-synthase n=1 Tax=Pseudoclavibacter caeni TaxID=908846 RepID=A0A7C8FY80_9MICO|nr:cystathionine gamma-synthase [Pseudoclavibacter caeni]KAB1633800.1 cystathionine gamma-synthase [Pseudoclavibacter caeni]NYJ96158.1 cystathionine gamma-synthase [Pseudoclavibacter caeni]
MTDQQLDAVERGFATRAIHVGQAPDPVTGDVIPPIHLSTTYAQDGVGRLRAGYDYSRSGNPTRDRLQEALASLEGATHAFSFASGLAAEDALLRSVLHPGERIVLGGDAYGGTFRLIDRVLRPWGVEPTPVDLTDADAAAAHIRDIRPRVVWAETPSNPLLGIVDIARIADVAHEVGALLVVDNTFATPYAQQPLAWGADVVLHSTTKYLGGHSDVVGGAVITSDDAIAEQVGFMQNAAGAVSSPFDAWLTHRGLKTLALRVRQHSASAQTIAEHLVGHPAIARVHYPGLASHPGHAIAARQQRVFGGMLSVELAGGEAAAQAFVGRTALFTLAESLGGVESLIELPAAMTHASVQGTALQVPAALVRISVGLEEVDDLIADLDQVLDWIDA